MATTSEAEKEHTDNIFRLLQGDRNQHLGGINVSFESKHQNLKLFF